MYLHMDANKINPHNETKKIINNLSNKELILMSINTGLPIIYEYPVFCKIIESDLKNKSLSKPCDLCKNFCDNRIFQENITRPKLTRQTNEFNGIDYKYNADKFDILFKMLRKKHFTEKDNK